MVGDAKNPPTLLAAASFTGMAVIGQFVHLVVADTKLMAVQTLILIFLGVVEPSGGSTRTTSSVQLAILSSTCAGSPLQTLPPVFTGKVNLKLNLQD